MSANKLADLEALLYAASRPVRLTDIVTWLRLENEREASDLIVKLAELYETDNSAIEVSILPQERVVLQLRTDFTKQASRYSLKPLLTDGPLRTLSYIAYNQPIESREVASVRGSQAYKHLKSLEEMGLIHREKEGRTSIIRTTQDFADYLGLPSDRTNMRRELRKMFRKLELDQIEKK
jgi:segregation and condensation protein B